MGPKTITKAIQDIRELILKHSGKIVGVYLENPDELAIALTVKFKPHRTGATIVKTGISFIESKIKDDSESLVDEKQRELFPRKDRILESVSGGQDETPEADPSLVASAGDPEAEGKW